MRAPVQLEELSEKQLEQQAVGTKGKPGLARILGWKAYHTLRSKGSEPGYPDWTLVRDRVVFLELKTARGKVSPAQREWLAALRDAGAEVYLVRPADLEALSDVLARRIGSGRPLLGRSFLDVRLRQELGETEAAA